MVELLLILAVVLTLLLTLDIASLIWGVDSRDKMEGPTWERRRGWGKVSSWV